MSWAISSPALLNGQATAAEAKEIVAADGQIPQSIKDYIVAGIEGVVAYYGDTLPPGLYVKVTGHGHVCQGPGSYNVTSATITVAPAAAEN